MYKLEESRSRYYFSKRTIDIACSLRGLSQILLIVGIAIRLKYIKMENLIDE